MTTGAGSTWRWPLAPLGARQPLVVAEHANDRHAIDLGYAPTDQDGALIVPVHAAHSGTVAAALAERGSFIVVLDDHEHAREAAYATRYAQLSHLRVAATDGLDGRARERVAAGDVIGFITRSPLRLRFELWRWDGRNCIPVDPYPALTSWGAPALDRLRIVSRN